MNTVMGFWNQSLGGSRAKLAVPSTVRCSLAYSSPARNTFPWPSRRVEAETYNQAFGLLTPCYNKASSNESKSLVKSCPKAKSSETSLVTQYPATLAEGN